MPNIVKLRRGTATQWAANNPVLASGEIGIELSASGSPQALKIGNGTSTWNALPYFIKAGGVPQPIAYGDAGAAGTSVEYARSDHKHAVSGFATPDDVNQLELRKESRGTNLVTNGGLMMGNNYNFPQLTYSGLESPVGYNGSLYTSIGIEAVSTEKIAINLAKKIRISAWIKWTHNGLSIPPNVREYNYLKFDFYDIDGNSIECRHCGYREGSTTFLTADLVAGQSVMQVDSVTGWDDTVDAFYRRVQIWNYANSYGYVYPEEVYTRNYKGFTSISGTTITLSSPHTGATIPAGTKVSQQAFGSNGWIMLGSPFISQVNEEWEYAEAFITESGKLPHTKNRSGLMPLATAYVKVRLHLNYQKHTGRPNANLDSTTYISGIRVDEMPDIGDFGNNSIPSSMLIDSFVKTDGTVPMTGLLSIESTQSGATTEVLYLKNNQTADNTAAALYFGFSTAANYYHAAIVASRTNLGGANASKLEFMLRRAITGTGKTFLKSLFSLFYDNTTPYASLAASLGVQITGNPTESVDVDGNLRLRNIPTTVGTFCIEVDNNGVFRKRTFAQTLADLGASGANHTHTISDLDGVAPLVHNHDDDYVSLTGKQTLTDVSDKKNSWMPFAYLTIENDAVYKNSAEYCGVLHMQSYSDSREPQEMFNIYVYMQKRGWNTNQEFTNQVPELVICLDGNHNLASNDVVAIMTDTDSVSQVFTFYIRLSASNKSYRTKITSGKGISYGRQYGDANDSYVTLTAITEAPAQAVLPTPAKGEVVEASLLTQVVPNSEVLTIHKKVNLQNQLTLAGTSILQRNSAGTLTVRTFAQTISDMGLLTTSHNALFDVHGRVIAQRFSDLAEESDELGKLAWLAEEKRMAYGLGYGGKDGVWQYLGITKVFPTVHDLMSETPISEGIIACALQEKIAFVSFWDGSVYQWSPLVNEDFILRRSCLPWEGLPSSPPGGHFQISYDKDVISFYCSNGGWQHLPVDSGQRIATPYDDYTIDPVLDKLILVDCSNDDVIITMPVIAQSMGREFIIRHHKGANMVKIKGQPNNTVDGQTTITLTTVKDFVRLINDGNSDWCLVGGAYS